MALIDAPPTLWRYLAELPDSKAETSSSPKWSSAAGLLAAANGVPDQDGKSTPVLYYCREWEVARTIHVLDTRSGRWSEIPLPALSQVFPSEADQHRFRGLRPVELFAQQENQIGVRCQAISSDGQSGYQFVFAYYPETKSWKKFDVDWSPRDASGKQTGRNTLDAFALSATKTTTLYATQYGRVYQLDLRTGDWTSARKTVGLDSTRYSMHKIAAARDLTGIYGRNQEALLMHYNPTLGTWTDLGRIPGAKSGLGSALRASPHASNIYYMEYQATSLRHYDTRYRGWCEIPFDGTSKTGASEAVKPDYEAFDLCGFNGEHLFVADRKNIYYYSAP